MIEQFNMPETAFERPSTLRATLRHWYIVLICAVLGAACGGVYAFKRPPVYTATARLSAISVNSTNAASLAGSLEAAQELASTFARVVQSSQVANNVARALHTTPQWAAGHVSGTPVPSSPFVMISANASTPGVAKLAANAALKSVDRYARNLVSASSAAPAMLGKIRDYSIQVTRAENHLGHLKGQAAGQARQASLLGGTSTTPSPRLQKQIEQASADVADAQAQLTGVQSAYTQQAENQLGSRQTVTASAALTANNDRKQVAQIAILLGLLCGLLIGIAGATLIASRSSPRG
jgi:hypothetical protein